GTIAPVYVHMHNLRPRSGGDMCPQQCETPAILEGVAAATATARPHRIPHPRRRESMSETTNTSAIEYDATQELSIKDANKVALGALIGTALEWYDFFLFSAAAALVFNVQYFTSENATAAALASF